MKKERAGGGCEKILRNMCIVCVCITGCACVYLVFCYQNTSAGRKPDRYGAVIEQVHSTVDKDGDGIDDQSDILQGALEYIAGKPKYKSRYYQTGYPDDEYGVCTDVVANALKSTGYDLMELVQKDIAENPEDYPLEEPDANPISISGE